MFLDDLKKRLAAAEEALQRERAVSAYWSGRYFALDEQLQEVKRRADLAEEMVAWLKAKFERKEDEF